MCDILCHSDPVQPYKVVTISKLTFEYHAPDPRHTLTHSPKMCKAPQALTLYLNTHLREFCVKHWAVTHVSSYNFHSFCERIFVCLYVLIPYFEHTLALKHEKSIGIHSFIKRKSSNISRFNSMAVWFLKSLAFTCYIHPNSSLLWGDFHIGNETIW